MSSFDWDNTTVKRLVDRYTTLNRKATPQDAEQSRVVRDVAEYYAANYDGTFEFMVKMHNVMQLFNKLSIGQASGVINCLMAEYRRLRSIDKADSLAYAKTYGDPSALQDHHATFVYPQAELPNLPAEIAANKLAELHQNASTPALTNHAPSIRELPIKGTCSLCGELTIVSYDTSLTPICVDKAACYDRVVIARAKQSVVTPACKNGTYTVVLNESGDYRTIKLSDVPETMNKRKGTQIAAYLSGSDNETNYTGFAFVEGTRFHLWKSHGPIGKSELPVKAQAMSTQALTVLLSAEKETQHDMGHAYAIESGNCFLCGRKLTVPASVARGLGPICAEKY